MEEQPEEHTPIAEHPSPVSAIDFVMQETGSDKGDVIAGIKAGVTFLGVELSDEFINDLLDALCINACSQLKDQWAELNPDRVFPPITSLQGATVSLDNVTLAQLIQERSEPHIKVLTEYMAKNAKDYVNEYGGVTALTIHRTAVLFVPVASVVAGKLTALTMNYLLHQAVANIHQLPNISNLFQLPTPEEAIGDWEKSVIMVNAKELDEKYQQDIDDLINEFVIVEVTPDPVPEVEKSPQDRI